MKEALLWRKAQNGRQRRTSTRVIHQLAPFLTYMYGEKACHHDVIRQSRLLLLTVPLADLLHSLIVLILYLHWIILLKLLKTRGKTSNERRAMPSDEGEEAEGYMLSELPEEIVSPIMPFQAHKDCLSVAITVFGADHQGIRFPKASGTPPIIILLRKYSDSSVCFGQIVQCRFRYSTRREDAVTLWCQYSYGQCTKTLHA